MKKENESNKKLKKDEFRKNNSRKGMGHPAYIFEKVGHEYKYLGLTHSKITKNTKNIKLEQNPNPKDSRRSYVRPVAEKEKANKFGKALNGWKFSKKDKKIINKIKKKS